jgi:hypothetical protein
MPNEILHGALACIQRTMKLTHIIIFGLLVISCSTSSQPRNNDLKDFNDFLGKEKANALNAAVKTFDQFLKTNYSDFDNQTERTKAFLEYLQENFKPDSTWNLPTKRNLMIISEFESSELRKEIWIYGYEEYEPQYDIYEILPPEEKDTSTIQDLGDLDLDDLFEEEIIPISNIDSADIERREKEMDERMRNSLHFNSYGQYLYALTKYTLNDTIIQGYVDVKILVGDISPALIASGLLSQEIDFENPFIKRILVTEFYYWIMKWDIERKEKI